MTVLFFLKDIFYFSFSFKKLGQIADQVNAIVQIKVKLYKQNEIYFRLSFYLIAELVKKNNLKKMFVVFICQFPFVFPDFSC